MAGIWSPAEVVTAAKLNKLGGYLLYDSTDAGVTYPVASITTSTLDTTNFAHLMVLYRGRCSSAVATGFLGLRVNGVSTANYYDQRVTGTAAATTVAETLAQTFAKVGLITGASATSASQMASGSIFIPHYAEASFFKAILGATAAMGGVLTGTGFVGSFGAVYQGGVQAISSLTFLDQTGGNLVAGSRFSVYGIAG